MANGIEDNPRTWTDTQQTLSFLVVVSFIVIVVIWMFKPPSGDPGAIAVLNTLVGALGGFAATVIGYFFGSNKAAKDKDDTIKEIAMAPTPVAVVPAAPAKVITTAPAEPSTTETITTVTTDKKD